MADIIVDTHKLNQYAQKLIIINARISALDACLNSLYTKVSLSDLWNLILSDVFVAPNRKLLRCSNYLNDTATDILYFEEKINFNNYLEEALRNRSGLIDIYFEGLIDKFNDINLIMESDVSVAEKVKGMIGWLSGIRKDAGEYKTYLEWIKGKDIDWPTPIKDGFDFIKALDTCNKLIFGGIEYWEGLFAGDAEKLTNGAEQLLGVIKAGVTKSLETKDMFVNFKTGFVLDYGKNMVTNWLESIQIDSELSEVYWSTFVKSAFEVVQDTTCNTPTLAIAYIPASIISDVAGYDLQGAYEKVSDKKGFAAVTDGVSRCGDLIMENLTWENWKSGMGLMIDGFFGLFK